MTLHQKVTPSKALPSVKRFAKITAVLSSIALVASCSTAASEEAQPASGGGVENEINLKGVYDLTGSIAFAGVGVSRGINLAIEEIEEQEFLGEDIEINLEEFDTAEEIERATSEVNRAVMDPEVDAIFGPVAAQQAAAVAPMVEEAGVPTVFNQAGADGVVIGDYTFRSTAPMHTFYDIAVEYLADEGLTDVALMYNASFPTFAELGENYIPQFAEEHGVTITSMHPAQSSTQDFTSQAQSIAREDPDAVIMLLIMPQAVTALTQLGEAGYEGQVIAQPDQSAGNAAEAGKYSEGIIYPVDFSAAQENDHALAFVEAFTDKYGEAPDHFAAEGYDSMWWLARGIKASGDSSREGIREGMQQVAEEGFEGVMGDLRFEGNDMRVPGVLVRWDGSSEEVMAR